MTHLFDWINEYNTCFVEFFLFIQAFGHRDLVAIPVLRGPIRADN